MGTEPAAAVAAALAGQGSLVSDLLGRLPHGAWATPTRCLPWTIAELTAHLVIGLSRLATMPTVADGSATADAADYYRWIARRDAQANRERVSRARDFAARAGDPASLVSCFDAALRETATDGKVRAGAIVPTRWGAAMSMEAFLSTRVVELTVHSLDLTDARLEPPVLDAHAARLAADVLVGALEGDPRRVLGWTDEQLLRVAAGRKALREIDRVGLGRIAARLPVLR